MNNNLRKLQLWFGGMGLLALLVVGSLAARPGELTIHSDPRDFLLRESDLHGAGVYEIPLHERHVISNDLVVYLLGDEAGEKRIQLTGRVVGWRVHFVRTAGGSAPDNITQTVIQFASEDGAQLNLDTYLLSIQNPKSGWRLADSVIHLGDASRIETRSQVMPDGSRREAVSISFTYRNIGVRLEAVGGDVHVLQDQVIALARMVLARLSAAEPLSGPVPSPTPGFDSPEEGRMIYR